MKPAVVNAAPSAPIAGAPPLVVPRPMDALIDTMNSRRASLHASLEKQNHSSTSTNNSAQKDSTNSANFSALPDKNFENKPAQSVWLFFVQWLFKRWWKHHPARHLLHVTESTVLRQAQQHPGKLLIVGAALGSALVLLKPWRHLGGWGSLVAAGALAAKSLKFLKTYRSLK